MSGGLATLHDLVFRINPSDINWNFKVNTSVTETVGGRVIQVLGATLSNITVTGYYGEDRLHSGNDGPGQSWRMAEAFVARVRELMDLQSKDAVAPGQGNNAYATGAAKRDTGFRRAHEPIMFTYPAKKWAFEVYIMDITDPTGGTVSHTTGKFSYSYTLSLFIVEDRSATLMKAGTSNGVLDSKKLAAIKAYIGRISAGVGWKQTTFNDIAMTTDIAGKKVPWSTTDNSIDPATAPAGTAPASAAPSVAAPAAGAPTNLTSPAGTASNPTGTAQGNKNARA